MSRSVFLLLSILVVQGRGCDHFMKNLLSRMKNEHHGFREVFPKDYKIRHHYSDSLLYGSDPCRLLRDAYMLSHSWSQLLLHLWTENIKYPFIMQLKEKLDSISDGKFLGSPDPSVFPPVSSTPETLLALTSTFFSRWLEQCPSPVGPCEFPLPPNFTEEEKKRTPAPFTTTQGRMEGGERQQRFEAPPTGVAASTHLSVSYILWCFPLLWAAL